MSDEAIWYVAYGSNVSGPRLQRYLDRCTDPTAPRDRRATTLPHRLLFARSSRWWDDGGVGFVDATVDHGAGTLGVAWLIGFGQFVELLAQENGQLAGTIDAQLDSLPSSPGASVEVHSGWYGVVLGAASPDERPAFTFTTAAPLPDPTKPSDRYVRTIADGLVDGHGLSEQEALEYLAVRGG